MKNLFILFIATFLFACSSQKKNATSTNPMVVSAKDTGLTFKKFKGDTLAYINEKFIKRKDAYLGKELSVLLKDIELTIEQYMYGTNPRKSNISEFLVLVFLNRAEVDQKTKEHANPMYITVTWETPLKLDEVIALYNETNRKWTEKVKEFYGKRKIINIEVSKNF